MWSFGCTVAELFTTKNTVFSDGSEDGGLSSDLVLLRSITSILGTPTSETWPESMIPNLSFLITSQGFQRLGQGIAYQEAGCAT